MDFVALGRAAVAGCSFSDPRQVRAEKKSREGDGVRDEASGLDRGAGHERRRRRERAKREW